MLFNFTIPTVLRNVESSDTLGKLSKGCPVNFLEIERGNANEMRDTLAEMSVPASNAFGRSFTVPSPKTQVHIFSYSSPNLAES
jgi:hypothetical protein